eukprot:17195_1
MSDNVPNVSYNHTISNSLLNRKPVPHVFASPATPLGVPPVSQPITLPVQSLNSLPVPSPKSTIAPNQFVPCTSPNSAVPASLTTNHGVPVSPTLNQSITQPVPYLNRSWSQNIKSASTSPNLNNYVPPQPPVTVLSQNVNNFIPT